MKRSGRGTEPGTNTEVLRNEKARNNSKSELVQNRLSDGAIDNAYDNTNLLCAQSYFVF